MNTSTYRTPATAEAPLRVVVFEREEDGSPGYRTFRARKVSVGPTTTMFLHPTGRWELVETDDVLDETPLEEVES